MENSIPSAFMHVNWSQLRKSWIMAVNACNTPRDFARAMFAVHACIKPVVFASVWHEQLGKNARLNPIKSELVNLSQILALSYCQSPLPKFGIGSNAI